MEGMIDERKDLIQNIVDIDVRDLLESVSDVKNDGYRLGQACASMAGDDIELLYTFEKDETLLSYKLKLPCTEPEIQSITNIYWYAFIYENEMHDLFGISFKNLVLDYGGEFFKIAEKTPWNPAMKGGAS